MLPRVLCLSPATFRVRYMSLHSREKGEEEEEEEENEAEEEEEEEKEDEEEEKGASERASIRLQCG